MATSSRGGLVVRAPTSHLGELGSIPGGVALRFSHVGIVPDGDAGRRVFSGISHLPRTCISALLHTHFTLPSSALKTSIMMVLVQGCITFQCNLVSEASDSVHTSLVVLGNKEELFWWQRRHSAAERRYYAVLQQVCRPRRQPAQPSYHYAVHFRAQCGTQKVCFANHTPQHRVCRQDLQGWHMCRAGSARTQAASQQGRPVTLPAQHRQGRRRTARVTALPCPSNTLPAHPPSSLARMHMQVNKRTGVGTRQKLSSRVLSVLHSTQCGRANEGYQRCVSQTAWPELGRNRHLSHCAFSQHSPDTPSPHRQFAHWAQKQRATLAMHSSTTVTNVTQVQVQCKGQKTELGETKIRIKDGRDVYPFPMLSARWRPSEPPEPLISVQCIDPCAVLSGESHDEIYLRCASPSFHILEHNVPPIIIIMYTPFLTATPVTTVLLINTDITPDQNWRQQSPWQERAQASSSTQQHEHEKKTLVWEEFVHGFQCRFGDALTSLQAQSKLKLQVQQPSQPLSSIITRKVHLVKHFHLQLLEHKIMEEVAKTVLPEYKAAVVPFFNTMIEELIRAAIILERKQWSNTPPAGKGEARVRRHDISDLTPPQMLVNQPGLDHGEMEVTWIGNAYKLKFSGVHQRSIVRRHALMEILGVIRPLACSLFPMCSKSCRLSTGKLTEIYLWMPGLAMVVGHPRTPGAGLPCQHYKLKCSAFEAVGARPMTKKATASYALGIFLRRNYEEQQSRIALVVGQTTMEENSSLPISHDIVQRCLAPG
ncbi:hypothetical protein PR048_028314 [Dryococelus australis]|uniref:Uncharacterized protein n=1 Tax=Dryococelus australis TaxID=614101 RepID=A0ABQ9GIZ7_9NEOP|nr:hypothetical protein PR048_028314 [Dryococelus australis]